MLAHGDAQFNCLLRSIRRLRALAVRAPENVRALSFPSKKGIYTREVTLRFASFPQLDDPFPASERLD
jgi:hypothetical protein